MTDRKTRFLTRLEQIMTKKGFTSTNKTPNEFEFRKKGFFSVSVSVDDKWPGEANWTSGGWSGNDSYRETLCIVNRLASGAEC
jgi:hypothetical protein